MTEIQKRQGDWDKIERGLNWSKWAFPRDLKKKVFRCECCDVPGSGYISSDPLFAVPPSHHLPQAYPLSVPLLCLRKFAWPAASTSSTMGQHTAATTAKVGTLRPLRYLHPAVLSPLLTSAMPMVLMCHPSSPPPSAQHSGAFDVVTHILLSNTSPHLLAGQV